MNNIKNSHIAGIGYYVPDRVIDNNYFTKYRISVE